MITEPPIGSDLELCDILAPCLFGLSMKKNRTLTQEAFNRLLQWLDPDRTRAGEKYQEIHKRLVMILTRKGSLHPEELADEVMNRVALKMDEIAEKYVGDTSLYFYSVANYVYLESLHNRPAVSLVPMPDSAAEKEIKLSCLQQCLRALPPKDRELVDSYFQFDSRSKSDFRRALADRNGMSLESLRMRIHRLRKQLKECVQQCIERQNV